MMNDDDNADGGDHGHEHSDDHQHHTHDHVFLHDVDHVHLHRHSRRTDLVAFQHVLKGAYLHPEAFHQAKKDQDFVLPVGVTMDESLALNNFTNGLEL